MRPIMPARSICLALFSGTRLKHERRQTKFTSEGGFHGSLHHPDKQLKTLGVLGKAGGECCQGVGMTTQILQGNPLTKVGLD